MAKDRKTYIYNKEDDENRLSQAKRNLENDLQRQAVKNAEKIAHLKAKLDRENLLKLSDEEAEALGRLEEKRAALDLQRINKNLEAESSNLKLLSDYRDAYSLAGIRLTHEQELVFLKDVEKYKNVEQTKRQERLKKEEQERQKKLSEQERRDYTSTLFAEGATSSERIESIKGLFSNITNEVETSFMNNIDKTFSKLVSRLTAGIDSTISSYAQMQGSVNARLQGSRENLLGFTGLEKGLTLAVGIQPYIKTETLLKNLSDLVDKGISYNVDQRAFLATIAEDIATTFDVATESLLRIVRLQQSDSTAARLGTEAYLTRFLNSMFENTEYLNNQYDAVASALLEASSQMINEQSIAFEYTVQKWLGSLSSVGLSTNSVSNIASAIGYLGSGDITSLSNNQGMQNLLIMSANKAGLNYAELLTEGLNASNVNDLLEAMVGYLQQIATTDNQVVRSQYASIFGLSISDLTAASNLTQLDIDRIASSSMDYAGAIGELYLQAATIPLRKNISELVDTLWSNLQFGIGTNVASNPATYALWQVTKMLSDYTEGINIPFINAAGFGIDLNTSVDNLMRLGIVGMSSLGLIGDLVSGLSSTLVPSSMFLKMGILPFASAQTRGTGLSTTTSGLSTSSETFVGNSSGSDLGEATLNQAMGEAQEELDVKKQEQEDYTEKLYDYVEDSLDSKLDAIISLLGYSAGGKGLTNVSSYVSSITDNFSTNVLENGTPIEKLLMGLGTTTANISNSSDESFNEIMSTISSNVSEIRRILEQGVIRVTIDNAGGLLSNDYL